MSDTPQLTDVRLLEHADWTQALARSLVHNPADAADLAQETALVALRRGTLEDIADLRSWLGKVVRNLARKRWRDGTRRATREQLSAVHSVEQADPSTLIERADTHRNLVETVLKLQEPHRTLLLQRYFDGLQPRDIAAREGLAVSTVSNRLTKAHRALRTELERQDPNWAGAVVLLATAGKASTPGIAATGVATAAAHAVITFSVAKVLAISAGIVGTIALILLAFPSLGVGGPAPFSPLQPPVDLASAADPEEVPDNTDVDAAARRAPVDDAALSSAGVIPPSVGSLRITVQDATSHLGEGDVLVQLVHSGDSEDESATPRHEVTTDSMGHAVVNDVQTGAWTAQLSIAGEVWPETARTLNVQASAMPEELLWEITRRGQIVGTAIDTHGDPVVGEALVLTTQTHAQRQFWRGQRSAKILAETTSDSSGRFVFGDLAPGDYSLGAKGDPWSRTVGADGMVRMKIRERPAAAVLEPITLPRNTAEVRADVRVWRDLYIRGKITFPDGRPAPDVLLLASLSGTRGTLRADSGPEGSFSFGPMPAGKYRVFDNSSPDGFGLFARIVLEAGDQDVHLTLRRSAILNGSIAGAPHTMSGWVHAQQTYGPSVGSGVSGQKTLEPGVEASFRFASLEPATYAVTFTSDDQAWVAHASDVTLLEGDDPVAIQLTPEPASQVTVHNRAEKGPLWILVRLREKEHFVRRRVAAGKSVTLAVPKTKVAIELEHRATSQTVRLTRDLGALDEVTITFPEIDESK